MNLTVKTARRAANVTDARTSMDMTKIKGHRTTCIVDGRSRMGVAYRTGGRTTTKANTCSRTGLTFVISAGKRKTGCSLIPTRLPHFIVETIYPLVRRAVYWTNVPCGHWTKIRNQTPRHRANAWRYPVVLVIPETVREYRIIHSGISRRNGIEYYFYLDIKPICEGPDFAAPIRVSALPNNATARV